MVCSSSMRRMDWMTFRGRSGLNGKPPLSRLALGVLKRTWSEGTLSKITPYLSQAVHAAPDPRKQDRHLTLTRKQTQDCRQGTAMMQLNLGNQSKR